MISPALKNIRRSPYQALSAIFVLSLNLYVIAIFLLVSVAAQLILNHFETRPQVIAYLKDDAPINEINELVGVITATGEVKDIKYISKEEALKIYRDSVGNDPLLLGTVTDLGEVTADILPASIEISAKNTQSFESIVRILENSKIISSTPQGQKEIDFPRDIINELSRWTKAIRTGGMVLILALTLTSIVTIGTIISLKISSRRLEINTMKLIGAKNSFILKPFIWETIIYSLSASFIGWLATFITLLYSTPFLAGRLAGIISFPIPTMILINIYLIILTFSLILGLLSGIFASIRFLRR